MISLQTAVYFIFLLIIAGVIFWLLSWAIDYVGIPDPFRKVARVVLVLLAVFVLIGLLLSLVGGQPIFRP